MTKDVYLVLGCAGSGRREVITDLLQDEAKEDSPTAICLLEEDRIEEADKQLAELPGVSVHYFESLELMKGANALPAETLFLLNGGSLNPVDFVEQAHDLLESPDVELAKVFTVVHCQKLQEHSKLNAWYEACIHFSDVVLLNRREGVEDKVVNAMVDHYKNGHYPCLFVFVKKGQVANPALVLEPDARRMSLYFDPDEDNWLDEEYDPEDEDTIDPYIRSLPSGQREKRIPDIRQYL